MKTVIIGLVVCLYGSFNAVAQEPLNTKKVVVKTERGNHPSEKTPTKKRVSYSDKKAIHAKQKINAVPAKRLDTK